MSHSKLTPAAERAIRSVETLFPDATGSAPESVQRAIGWLSALERSPYPTRSDNAEVTLQYIALLEQMLTEQREEFTFRIGRAVSRLRMLNEEFARHRWCEPFAKEFFEETILILLRKERRNARN